MKKILGTLATCAVMIMVAFPVQAGTVTGSLQVTATVDSNCAVNASALAFGIYNPMATNPLDVNGQISLTCTKNTAYVVSLGLGLHSPGGSTRRMAGASDFLIYDIYSDSARTVLWALTNTVSGTSTSSTTPINLPAYGRIPEHQDVLSGAYNDTVFVTVNF
jgi:spore coat protein U-like protein